MTETNPLHMNQQEFEQSEKERKARDKKLAHTRFSYARGNTALQQKKSIRQYNKAKLRFFRQKAQERKEKSKRLKSFRKNAGSLGKSIYRVAKTIPRQHYSESGRLGLLSNLRRGIPVEQGNILNAQDTFIQKTDKRRKYSLL